MKRKVRVAILGAMLHGSAHAAVQNVSADPSLDKGQDKAAVVQNVPASGKKGKAARGKNKTPAAEPAEVAKPDVQKQDDATGNASDTSEQTVQLRGVRG